MFTGIFNSGDLAVDTTASESAGNQNTGYVTKQFICIFSVTVSESIHLIFTTA